jgi:hypothetical protein
MEKCQGRTFPPHPQPSSSLSLRRRTKKVASIAGAPTTPSRILISDCDLRVGQWSRARVVQFWRAATSRDEHRCRRVRFAPTVLIGSVDLTWVPLGFCDQTVAIRARWEHRSREPYSGAAECRRGPSHDSTRGRGHRSELSASDDWRQDFLGCRVQLGLDAGCLNRSWLWRRRMMMHVVPACGEIVTWVGGDTVAALVARRKGRGTHAGQRSSSALGEFLR